MLPRAVLATLLAAAPLLAQGGGFTANDLVLYSAKIPGASPTNQGLVLMDTVAGTSQVLVGATQVNVNPGNACFDLHRQRVLFTANLDVAGKPGHLWAANADGELDDLGFVGVQLNNMAPTGDGRIYLNQSLLTTPFRYIDAANRLQTLMDETGSAPFVLQGSTPSDLGNMIYESATNALFLASGLLPCPGGATSRINVRKLPLSPDGQRVTGPITCAQFDVAAPGEGPAGWSRGPGGQLMLVVDIGGSGVAPKILSVDPATLAISVFASSGGYFGDAGVPGGTWAPGLDKAVILDSGGNHLRAYAAGDSGVGQPVFFSGAPISGLGGSACTLFAIDGSPCTGGWMPYGPGLAGTGGFVPTLTGLGYPMVDGLFGLSIAEGLGGATAQIFVGLAAAATPFKGGTFLVDSPVLQATLALGGTPGAAGVGSLVLPAALPADPLLEGLQLFLQVGLADAGAVRGAALSNGLRMEIGA